MHGSYTASRHPTESDSDLLSSDPAAAARAPPAAKPAAEGHEYDLTVPGKVPPCFRS